MLFRSVFRTTCNMRKNTSQGETRRRERIGWERRGDGECTVGVVTVAVELLFVAVAVELLFVVVVVVELSVSVNVR